MPSVSFLGRFDFEKSYADLPILFCNNCQLIVSESGGARHVCRTAPTTIYGYPMCYLPHTIITCDLGLPNGIFHLEFNRISSENSALAVFSLGQEAPISDTWSQCLQSRGSWPQFFSTTSSQCRAIVSVGSYWPLRLSSQAIWYWNAEDGVILVDWSKLYSDYFAQARTSKSKRRIERIVRRYRDLEAETMRRDTNGRWSSYGDWDIFPATHEEVAMACRYEGPRSNFEDRLDPRRNRMRMQELIMRIGDGIVAVGEAIRRRVDGKPKSYEAQEKAKSSQGPVSLWNRASYARF